MSDDTGFRLRLFIAVLIPGELKRRIVMVQEPFKKIAPEVKWVAEENFHVTLKFLGSVRSDCLERIAGALVEAVGDMEPFEIEVGGVGAFPSHGRPRTVWVGVTSGSEKLGEVARQVEKRLEKLGFPREERPFRSHITIGRVRDSREAGNLPEALHKADAETLGSVKVNSIAVMKSELRREGPIYSMLKEVCLRGAEGEQRTNG